MANELIHKFTNSLIIAVHAIKIREYNSHKFCKTKPIYSLCVLRPLDFAQDKDAYCERNLKKQSQFENTQMSVSALITRDYGKSRKWTFGENKPNQSQSFDGSTTLTAGFAQDRKYEENGYRYYRQARLHNLWIIQKSEL